MSNLAEPGLINSYQCENVGVVRANGLYLLVACNTILAGERIFELIGECTSRPSRYSVQVGKQRHIDVAPGMSMEKILDSCFWKFMNHSCEPSAYICDRTVVAIRKIHPWEEITYNYNTVEYDMVEPFECCCNSPSCYGKIRGYKYLSEEERIRLRPFTARHLA